MVESLGHYIKDPLEIAKVLSQELEIEKVVITLGGEGILIYESSCPDKSEILPTIKTEVFDVSGAGDTVISLLTSAIVAGALLRRLRSLQIAVQVLLLRKRTATVDQSELNKYFQRYTKALSQ